MNLKRIFSVILALIVIASAVETISAAAEEKAHTQSGYSDSYNKKTRTKTHLFAHAKKRGVRITPITLGL